MNGIAKTIDKADEEKDAAYEDVTIGLGKKNQTEHTRNWQCIHEGNQQCRKKCRFTRKRHIE